MQNKGFIKFVAGALVLVCLYYLSFTVVTNYYYGQAKEYAQGDVQKEAQYLDSMSLEKVWMWKNLKQCREQEINLGLDLKGGMNVILELNVADVLHSLAGNKNDAAFIQALGEAQTKHTQTSTDFVGVFAEEYQEIAPNAKLAAIFSTFELKDRIKPESSNEEVITVLREELKSAIDNSFNVLRTRIDRFGVVSPNIQRLEADGRILIELPGVKEPERVKKLLQGSANLEFWETVELSEIYSGLIQANDMLREMAAPTEEEIAEVEVAPSDSTKTEDDLLALASQDSAAVSEQNAAKFKKENPLLGILMVNQHQGQVAPGPTVGTVFVGDTAQVMAHLNTRKIKELFPRTIFRWTVKALDERNQYFQLVALHQSNRDGSAALGGDVVTDAKDDFSQNNGSSEVSMSMNSEGAKAWARLTKDNIGKCVAIVLDGLVYSYPRVNDEITGGRSSISGDFTPEEAKDLANVLKSGKMAASISIIQEDVVGPSLGQAAINAGIISFVIALILLFIYMCSIYGLVPGMVANCALLINVFFTMGILASFQAVLTLSGIAGMVLTLGMAVDANVLIYERTREELRNGKSTRKALEDGYKNAFSAIFDSNLTTIITGVVLFYFGTGPIRGFATTLIIGLVSSFITAVFLTRIAYEGFFAKGKFLNLTFTAEWSKNILQNTKFDFLGKRKKGYLIPAGLIVVGIISLFTLGLNSGIDFTGGRNYQIAFDQAVNTEDIREELGEVFETVSVIQIGNDQNVRVSTNYKIDDNGTEVDSEIKQMMYSALTAQIGDISFEEFDQEHIVSSQKVGPSMADDIKNGAYLAIIFSMICMAIYILCRFRDISFSVGTLASIIVTVTSIIGLYSLLWKILPFSMEIDQTFVAAILTIIGYSMNDTVVVFDRIRETISLYPNRERSLVINDALNSTLARTFSTSLSTMIVVLCIFILGGSVIRSFTFAILLGIVIGTFCTLFVATPIAYEIQLRSINKKAKK